MSESPYADHMGFSEASGAGLRRWNDFRGRSSRSEFWWFQLFLFLIFMAYLVVLAVFYAAADAEPSDEEANVIVGLYALAIVIPALSIQIRRLRDAGLGWGFILLPLVPFLGSLALFIMFLLPSKAPEPGALTEPGLEPGRVSTPMAEAEVSTPGETVSQIERLAELHREGRITDEQFETAKRKVLGD